MTFNDGVAEMVTPLVEAASTRPRGPGEPALVFVNTLGDRIQNGSFHGRHWNPAVAAAVNAGRT